MDIEVWTLCLRYERPSEHPCRHEIHDRWLAYNDASVAIQKRIRNRLRSKLIRAANRICRSIQLHTRHIVGVRKPRTGFTSLPVEIRLTIYSFAFPKRICVPNFHREKKMRIRRAKPPPFWCFALFRVSRQVAAESFDAFVRNTELCFGDVWQYKYFRENQQRLNGRLARAELHVNIRCRLDHFIILLGVFPNPWIKWQETCYEYKDNNRRKERNSLQVALRTWSLRSLSFDVYGSFKYYLRDMPNIVACLRQWTAVCMPNLGVLCEERNVYVRYTGAGQLQLATTLAECLSRPIDRGLPVACIPWSMAMVSTWDDLISGIEDLPVGWRGITEIHPHVSGTGTELLFVPPFNERGS